MSDTKEYAALQEECERLRAENQRLNKDLARYRAKYGELSEPDKGGEIEPQSAEAVKFDKNKISAQSSDSAIVTNQSPSEEKIKLFRSLFRGREDVYAKRWYSEKSGKSGYQPVCLNEWSTWLCDKRKTKCSECKNRKFAPLDDGAIYKHLQGKSPNGTDVIGIYPLTEDEHCYFLAMDFDGSSWEDDIVAVPRFTDFRMPLAADSGFKTLDQIFAELCLSKNRNAMIVDDVVKAVNAGRMPIVLTERTEHAKLLTDAIEHRGVKTFLLIGKESAKQKREKLAAIAAAGQTERFVIVAVGRYVGEGFDFARLDTLFLAMPISWKGKLTQYAGRLHRDYVGKREVVIYDYVDLNVSMLENMYHKRIKGYKDIGYEIRIDAKTGKRGILFNKTDFKRIFNGDITSAHKEILIVSPSLIAGRVTKFLRVYSTLLDKPNVTVVTRVTDDEKAMQQRERLKRTGIAIQIYDDLHLRCAVIDGSLVWYGSISPLGYAGDTDSSLRFDSREIAEMLVSQLKSNG